MNTKNLNFVLITSLCLLLLSSCSGNLFNNTSDSFWIDNPLDKEITIKIDDKELKIPAKSGIKEKISFGTHELTYNESTIKFIAKPTHYSVVMNPTLSNYIAYPEIYYYSESETAQKRGEILLNSYARDYEFTDGITEKVPMRVFNSLFIENVDGKWDYDIETPFPEDITTNVAQNVSLSADMKVKLFREKDFIDHIGSDPGLRQPEYNKLSDLPTQYVVEEQYLNFDCPEAQPAGETLKMHIAELYSATSSDEFLKAYRFFNKNDSESLRNRNNLFPPTLNQTCPDGNYFENEREISESLSRFGDINAWIIK